MAALTSADGPYERRDRVVEVFRACVRLLATLALARRVQFGAGPGESRADALGELLEHLSQRGLTDGQWVALARELSRPWRGQASDPLGELTAMFLDDKTTIGAIDGLLSMRKAETVAHGATGDDASVAGILERRLPQLATLLTAQDPLWARLQLVVPVAGPRDEPARALRLRGTTPHRGRWRKETLPVALPDGEPVCADAEGRPVLALAPLALFRRPTPDAVEELFVLDGPHRRSAKYVALPSMAEHRQADVWSALEQAILGRSRDVAAEPAEAERPYRGLMAFGTADAARFFGRDAESESLANLIRRHGVVTVTGPSGSGKTSLLAAGVRPRVVDRDWVVVRPGARPLEALERRLAEADAADPIERARRLDRGVVVWIDQAEEVLTLCADPAARAAFAERVAALGADPDGPTRVVISVREDFFARLAELPGLGAVYARRVEVVRAPGREALVAILAAPLAGTGVAFEDHALVEAMVDAVAGEPAALALLQFCADRLWDRRDRTWKRLTWDAYRAIGEVAGALAQHAEEVVTGLPSGQRDLARTVFLRLVTPQETRAVVPRAELDALAPGVGPLVDALVEARLLTAREEDGVGVVVEVVHEALLRHWERLERWRSEDREGRLLLSALRDAAAAWNRQGRAGASLWSGRALEDWTAWAARAEVQLTPLERAFVASSELAGRRRASLRTWGAWGLGSAVLWVTVVLAAQWRVGVTALEDAERASRLLGAGPLEAEGRASEAVATLWATRDQLAGDAAREVDASFTRLAASGEVGPFLPTVGEPRVSFSADGALITTASGVSHAWDLRTGARSEVAGPGVEPPGCAGEVGDVGVTCEAGALVLVDRTTGAPLLRGPRASQVGATPDGAWAFATQPGGVRLYALAELPRPTPIALPAEPTLPLAGADLALRLAPGTRVSWSSGRRRAALWSGREIHPYSASGEAGQVRVAPYALANVALADGSDALVALGVDGEATLFGAGAPEGVALEVGGRAVAAAVEPDPEPRPGQRVEEVAVLDALGRLHSWSNGHSPWVTSLRPGPAVLAVAPDMLWLAAADGPDTVAVTTYAGVVARRIPVDGLRELFASANDLVVVDAHGARSYPIVPAGERFLRLDRADAIGRTNLRLCPFVDGAAPVAVPVVPFPTGDQRFAPADACRREGPR